MTITYLPKAEIYIATEPRTIPYEWWLAEDGMFPGLRKATKGKPKRDMPKHKLEKGRLPVTHVLAVGSTPAEAEERGRVVLHRQGKWV